MQNNNAIWCIVLLWILESSSTPMYLFTIHCTSFSNQKKHKKKLSSSWSYHVLEEYKITKICTSETSPKRDLRKKERLWELEREGLPSQRVCISKCFWGMRKHGQMRKWALAVALDTTAVFTSTEKGNLNTEQ